jgi:type I restriction enzyme S subunit
MSSDFSILSDNDDLPMGWVETTVGQVILPYETEQPTKKPDTEFTYIDISSIDNSTQTITDPKTFLGKDAPSRARRIVKEGDVLFSTVRTYLKNIALVSNQLDGALTSTGIAVLRPAKFVDSNWLFRFVTSENFVQEVGKSMDGSLYPAVTDKDVSDAPITLPPLNEQRRIVEKVEALMARSRRAKEALDAIPKLIEQFRQSVLAAAFRGDLTADWREQNPNIEPASVLLERIHEKRLELAATQRERSKVEAYYSKQENTTIEKFYNLPFNWEACRIQEIGNITNGSTPSRAVELYWEGNIPWVSSGEVRNNLITETRECITEQGYSNSSVKLLPKGTVLIAMIGEGKTRGQSSILQIEATINQNIAGILLNHNLVASEYLWYWLQYRYAINRIAGSGTGPQALNCQRVGEMQFILSPLEEQYEIVKRVKQIFQNLQIIQATSESVRENTNTLNQSILSKAFRGELVEQDPNDEPASVLLERIQKEREKEKAKVKQTGAKKLKK